MERFFIKNQNGVELAKDAGLKCNPVIGFLDYKWDAGFGNPSELNSDGKGNAILGWIVFAPSRKVLEKSGIVNNRVASDFNQEAVRSELMKKISVLENKMWEMTHLVDMMDELK